jgi:hypothetical protein
MDYSSVILNLLKEKEIRRSINPITYYGIKSLYKKDFQKRSVYFSKALSTLFESLGGTLDISLFDESVIEEGMNNTNFQNETMNDTLLIEMNKFDEVPNLNMTVNRDNYMNMSSLFNTDWKWTLTHLVDFDDEYILDKEDNYVLIHLIKSYLFSDEDARTSQLLISYNIFCSSIELIFCLKLVENFPKVSFNPRETKKFEKYTETLKTKINLFLKAWATMYSKKYQNSLLIQSLIGSNIAGAKDTIYLDLISLSMLEPLLTTKYLSFTKLIREGPFCFEVEEIARQLCIIDHELLATLSIVDYNNFMIRRNAPESFNKFYIREKQLRCYILLFILMQNALENKRIMIQNFILLAHTCKLLNNYQSCNTIISTLNMVGLLKKKLLWKLIEKKYREVFTNLENDLEELESNDNQQVLDLKNIIFPSVPCIGRIKNNINHFIIKTKFSSNDEKMKLCQEYKDFYLTVEEIGKNKYSFFKVNPLYDFFKFGFLEIFKPKKWSLKLRIDFSQYTEDSSQLDQLLEFLINGFKKLDN